MPPDSPTQLVYMYIAHQYGMIFNFCPTFTQTTILNEEDLHTTYMYMYVTYIIASMNGDADKALECHRQYLKHR